MLQKSSGCQDEKKSKKARFGLRIPNNQRAYYIRFLFYFLLSTIRFFFKDQFFQKTDKRKNLGTFLDPFFSHPNIFPNHSKTHRITNNGWHDFNRNGLCKDYLMLLFWFCHLGAKILSIQFCLHWFLRVPTSI